MIFDLPGWRFSGRNRDQKTLQIATWLQDGCPTPLGWLLGPSWSLLEAKKSSREASWMARRESAGGRREVDGRSRGDKGSIFGWPWPLGAPLIKEYRLITAINTRFMEGLNTPWAKCPANLQSVCISFWQPKVHLESLKKLVGKQ